MRLETLVVRMAEAVVRVREEMPLDGRAAGDEALPERALDGGCRDVVLAATADERGALQRPAAPHAAPRPQPSPPPPHRLPPPPHPHRPRAALSSRHHT